MRIAFLLSMLLLVSFTQAAEQEVKHWPQFRGPNGDGRADSAKLPLMFSDNENIKWKTEIHDKGWSSPVVWDDQIWLTTATEDGDKMFAVCVDRHSGAIVHDILVFENANPAKTKRFNSYASPTPVIEEGRVYIHFGSYGTACLDTKSGKTVWQRRDLQCNHWRGPGSSPVIDGNLLFVAFDGYDYQYVVALNKNTGKTVWKKDRKIEYGTDNGDLMKAFCTCSIIDYKGRRQLVAPSAASTVCYDPATGAELWRLQHGGMNAAVRPLFGHGLVYIAPGSNKTLLAVRPDGQGNVTETHVEWKIRKSAPMRPSPILLGEHLFMISDDSVASCLNAKTGDVIWQKRVGGGEYRASPIYANGRIYFFNMNGDVPVIKADGHYELLTTNKLGNGFYGSPAVVDNAMYVRSTKHLYCIQGE